MPWFVSVATSSGPSGTFKYERKVSVSNFFLFTGKERGGEKKAKLDWIPIHSHLPKTVNVKLIISTSRNENELRCRIIKVTDVMFLRWGFALLKLNIMEMVRKAVIDAGTCSRSHWCPCWMSCLMLEDYGLCYRLCGFQWKAGMMWERALIPLLPPLFVLGALPLTSG